MIIKRLKLISILISSMILLASCSGGSGGGSSTPPTKITAVPVNTSSLPLGFAPTFIGINAYIAFSYPPIGFVMFLPNGLQNPTPQRSQVTPQFWLINAFFHAPPYLPLASTSDNLGRIVIPASGVSSALLITLGTKNESSINANLLNANGFNPPPNVGAINTLRVIGNGSTPSAIGPFYSSESIQGLTFANFVPVNQSSTITGSSPNFALCKQTIPGSGESISATTTYNNSQSNQFLTSVGTSLGALCIYNFSQNSWISLTQSAINGGYPVGLPIITLQFVNFNNNLYLYWINQPKSTSMVTPGIWRSQLNNNNQPTSVTNLLDPSKFTNVPSTSTLSLFFNAGGVTGNADISNLFIDPYNNVYIGNSGSAITPNTPSIVYVLPSGSNAWQAVPLAQNESLPITAISLAVDGKTPVVRTYKIANESGNIVITGNTYYLQGINQNRLSDVGLL